MRKSTGITQKELFERAKKLKTYVVVKPLTGHFSKYKSKGVGNKYNSETLYETGYNIAQLLRDGVILEVPRIFPFEFKIVGKNVNSVWTKCKECMMWGINMPLEKDCGNCGYSKTITYYDAETVQRFIDNMANT